MINEQFSLRYFLLKQEVRLCSTRSSIFLAIFYEHELKAAKLTFICHLLHYLIEQHVVCRWFLCSVFTRLCLTALKEDVAEMNKVIHTEIF